MIRKPKKPDPVLLFPTHISDSHLRLSHMLYNKKPVPNWLSYGMAKLDQMEIFWKV
jgi:hypothetical protein